MGSEWKPSEAWRLPWRTAIGIDAYPLRASAERLSARPMHWPKPKLIGTLSLTDGEAYKDRMQAFRLIASPLAGFRQIRARLLQFCLLPFLGAPVAQLDRAVDF
jgi:hypothetical protein